jgi:chromatin remodeling complex protein RSC6
MATLDLAPEVPTVISTSDQLKNVLDGLVEQSSKLKSFINIVRTALKDVERQSKEVEKLRNKRSRNKADRNPNALPSGITKPVAITDDLAKFLKVAPGTLVPRNEVTKGVSSYVREHNLSDPENKQRFVLDDRPAAKTLRVLLNNPTEDVTYFNLQRYLKHHYIQSTEPKVTSKKAAPDAVVVPTTPAASGSVETPKKKILVKKVIKKSSELTEEA